MSEQSLTHETAFTVASTFLAYYYSEFVKLNELARMSDLYDERSYMTLVDFRDEVPLVAHGRSAVANLLAKLDSTLGQRKVEIITVDTVALPHNCVQVICQGVMYLREYRRVFLHVFVLEPTAYRTKTYHISSDYLRFVDSEKEVIPDGAVVIAADEVANYLAEGRRRIEEEQRRLLLEFQQRLRAQQEAAAAEAKAKAEAEAAQAKAQQQLHQQQQAASAVRIPQPASRQARGQDQQQRSGAEGRAERRERPERPARAPRDGDRREGRGERPERPERRNNNINDSAVGGGEEGGRPERRPREPRPEGRGAGRGGEGRGGERKPRENREHKPAAAPEKSSSAAAAEKTGEKAPATSPARLAEGSDNRKKPAATNANSSPTPAAAGAAAAAADRKPRRETGPTPACILLRVPKKFKLSDIKAELASAGGATPEDTFWCGRDSIHAVLKFDTVEKATALVSKKVFVMQGESISIRYYNE
jgi:hypothetical protein